MLPRQGLPVEKLRTIVRLAVVFPVLVVGLICGLLIWEVRELLEQDETVSHTERVIGQINLTQKLLLDQETGLRGYLLSSETLFLEPHTRGKAAMPAALTELATLVSDNPSQRARLESLRGRYEAWQEQATRVQESPDVRPASMRARKVDMDAMRELTAAMLTEEERLLFARKAKVERVTKVVLWGGAAVGLILGAIVAIATRAWIAVIERVYRLALSSSEQSEAGEREARRAAEALATDITEQSREMEQHFKEMRAERDRAQERVAALEAR